MNQEQLIKKLSAAWINARNQMSPDQIAAGLRDEYTMDPDEMSHEDIKTTGKICELLNFLDQWDRVN